MLPSDLALPPHNIEAEKGVLCCILLNNENLSILDEVGVTSESFYQKEHKIIMENIEALRFAGKSIDVVTLCDCLGDDLDKIGGQEYMLTLSMCLLFDSVCREYCEMLVDKQMRRDTINLTSKIQAACYSDKNVKSIIARSVQRLNEMTNKGIVIDTDNNPRFYEKSDLISRGNKCVDDVFGYMCNDLVIVYAGAGTGKTEWMCHIADYNGREGKRVVYYALENSPRALKQRSSYRRIGLSKAEFQRGEYNEQQKQIITDNYKSFDKRFELTTHDRDIFKMLVEIETKAREGYDVIVVDNLGKITRDGHNEFEVEAKFTGDCQTIKNKYKNVTIVIVHHEKKRQIKNSPGQMRGNNKIEDNSTIMIQIWRDRDPDELPEVKRLLRIEQSKDTEGGVDAKVGIYYNKSKYYDEYNPSWDKEPL